jgi:PKD repeat protein
MTLGRRQRTASWFVLALFLAETAAADLYVASSGDNSTGADWDTALTSIQAALNAAQPGDTIYLKGETFLTDAQLTWTQSLVAIRGGYAGNTIGGLPGQRDIRQWPTVIQRSGVAVHRVLQAVGVTNGFLDGITLQNGQSSGKDAGAGLHITFCSNLFVTACAMVGNYAYNPTSNLGNLEGGGVYISNSYVTVSNCLIRGNTNQTAYASTISHALGGGIAVLTGAVTISECLIMDNVLIAARNTYGAGLYILGGTHRIEHTVLQGNYGILSSGGLTYNRGDGFYLGGTNARAALFNSLVNGNYRDGVHVEAGATLHILNSTITGHGRYGANRTNAWLAITNSILWRNDVDVGGTGTIALGWSLIGDGRGFGTNGVIRNDPLFERGLYLATNSPARDAGSGLTSDWSLADRTTSTNAATDTGVVDMGYHFRPGSAASAADGQVQFDPAKADLFVAAGGTDANPGTEAEPFRSITRALTGASAGSRIHVGAGFYTNGIETFPLMLDKPGLQILGAGASNTIVSARGVTNSRVLTARGVTGDGRLAGFTAAGSFISKTAVVTGATALLTYNADAFWRARRGGGILLANCAMDLTDIAISSNILRGAANEHVIGGGLYALWSWGVMSNLVAVSNQLADGQSNTGEGYGGGLYLYEGRWLITHSVISSNVAGFGNNGGNYGGGAILLGAHTLANSRIEGNLLAGQAGAVRRGGGLYLNGGMVRDCRIATNRMTTTTSTNANGGGVFLAVGNLRNCLIIENAAIRDGGGIYALTNASAIESVTVAGNHTVEAGFVAGVYLVAPGSTPGVTNCIFAHNYRDFDVTDVSVTDTGGTFAYSCTRPGRAGTGNVDGDPGFTDYTIGDYRLGPGAPTIDTALEQSWMTNALDMDGNPRIRNLIPDMGALEAPGPNDGPFQASFSGTPLQAMDALDVVFTAAVQGSNTTGVVYWWDFDNNGVFDSWGPDKQVVTNLYTAGRYSVRMLATNAVGETNETVRPNYVFVSPSVIYVSTTGDHSDGTSWARAFTNVPAALDMAWQSNIICLAGETFWLHDALSWSSQNKVSFLGGFEGVGSPGARDPALWPTILRRNPAAGNFRLLRIVSVTEGLLSGLTFADGYTTDVSAQPVAPGSGGAIRLTDSSLAIEQCIFTNNQARTSGNSYMWGGALYAESSTVTIRDSLFANNLAYGGPLVSANNRAYGGALAANGCTTVIWNCRFLGNTAEAGGNQGCYGGALYLTGGSNLVRNTLAAFNRAGVGRPRGQGGGFFINSGTRLENVTVVSNEVWNDGYFATTAGGLYAPGGQGVNVIVWFNTDRTADAPSDIYTTNVSQLAYSCAPELDNPANFNITQNPRFGDLAAGDFTPLASSPCRNTGTNMDWMTGATDLAGRPRILTGRVDMGAFEIPPPAGGIFRTR